MTIQQVIVHLESVIAFAINLALVAIETTEGISGISSALYAGDYIDDLPASIEFAVTDQSAVRGLKPSFDRLGDY